MQSKPSLEEQIAELATFGVCLNESVDREELFMFYDKAALEELPYRRLVETLGQSQEGPPETPLASTLWMLDTECVEDHGDYVRVLERLELMTGAALGLSDIKDHVDPFEDGVVWVSFVHEGATIRWDMEASDDWLDPTSLTSYAELLNQTRCELRLFALGDVGEFGQSIFLAALTPPHQRAMTQLTGIQMTQLP